MIRVVLPHHLRTLAGVGAEVTVDVPAPVSIGTILDALEANHPMLKGTIRDHVTRSRRPFIRFFATGEDYSNASPEQPLPEAIANGEQPFMVVGAIAGG